MFAECKYGKMQKSANTRCCIVRDVYSNGKNLIEEKTSLEKKLAHLAETEQKGENAKKRVEDIVIVMDGLKNHPLKYEDKLVRQVIEYIVVESKEKIKVVFKGGFEIEQSLY